MKRKDVPRARACITFGSDVNARQMSTLKTATCNGECNTSLIISCVLINWLYADDIDMVRMLIDVDASVDSVHRALFNANSANMAKVLISNGAKLSKTCSVKLVKWTRDGHEFSGDNMTPLHYTFRMDVAHVLVDEVASPPTFWPL